MLLGSRGGVYTIRRGISNPITHVLISLCGPHSSSGKWKWSDAVSASWLVKTRLQALKSPFGSFKLALTFAEPLMVHTGLYATPRCIEMHYAKFDLKIVFIQKKISCHFILFLTKFTRLGSMLLHNKARLNNMGKNLAKNYFFLYISNFRKTSKKIGNFY